MTPSISVIVPVYNKEKDLEKCINSLLNQTFKNIEIILVNDGSSDRSGEICDFYSEKHENIKSLHKKNGGVSSARNTGMEQAIGEYLAFVDPDDYVSIKLFERLYTEIKNTQFDIISCCATVETDTHKYKNSFFTNMNPNQITLDKHSAIVQLIYSKYYEPKSSIIDIGVPWGKLYKKSLIDKNNLHFNEDLRRMQDNIFNLYAFQYAQNIGYIDEPLYFYNNKNISQVFHGFTSDVDKLLLKVIDETNKYINEFQLNKEEDIKIAFNAKKTGLLLTMLRSKYLNLNYKVPMKQRVTSLRKIFRLKYFKNIHTGEHLKFFSKKNVRVIQFLHLVF